MNNKKLISNILLLSAALIWGVSFVFQRKGMEYIEPLTFAASRLVLAALSVAVLAFVMDLRDRRRPDFEPKTGEEARNYKKNTVLGGVLAGLCLVGAGAFQQMGVVYTTAGKAGFITTLYMMLVPIINFAVFRKKSPLQTWVGVVLGVIGLYLLCMTDKSFSLTKGDTLVMICSIFFALHILTCDHFVDKGNPVKISAIQFITACVCTWVLAFLFEEPTWAKILSAMVPIAYCGIMSGGVGYTFQILAQKNTDPTIAALLLSLESVFAVIAGAIMLKEMMSTRELLGCLVMFVAIILVQIPLPSKKTKKENA
ncbi:MAG: DMT family transporter [Firmicutes bacterium]|nr:DMT family transporter [Bacillota bacterium]